MARHTRSGGWPVRPGQTNTIDDQQPTKPAVRWRRQGGTNKTSRASSRLQHHEPKPKDADTTRPTKGGATHKHGTPQQGGGHAPAQHHPRPSKQQNRNRHPPNRRRQPGPTATTAAGRHQHGTPHQEGGHAPTPHTQPWGLHTPTQHAQTLGGGTHRHSTPQQGGATHQHSTNPGKANTKDNQHRTTPAVGRRRQQQTNKTSRVWSQLQHQEPKPKHADTTRPTKGGARTNTARPNGEGPRTTAAPNPAKQTTRPKPQPQPTQQTTTTGANHHQRGRRVPTQHAPPRGWPRTTTARPTMRGATSQRSTSHHWGGRHQHSTPHTGGGHAPAQHRPRPGKHHRQPTADNAGRTAAETTTNQQNKPSIYPFTTPRTETRTRRHSTPHHRGGPRTNTARPNRGGGKHQHNTKPGEANNTTATATQQTTTPPHQAQPRPPSGTNTALPTMRGATHQHSTPHHEGGHKLTQQTPDGGVQTPTQHALAWGRARTTAARPTKRGAHQHRTNPG